MEAPAPGRDRTEHGTRTGTWRAWGRDGRGTGFWHGREIRRNDTFTQWRLLRQKKPPFKYIGLSLTHKHTPPPPPASHHHRPVSPAACPRAVLNEIGLDPGIDHLGAMKIIDDVKERGGKIKEFISYCGGPFPPRPGRSDLCG